MTEPACEACALESYEPPDYDAFRPPVLNHTCVAKGPKTRKQVLEAIAEAAHRLYHSFASKMPGGNYHARAEIEALLVRVAAIENK